MARMTRARTASNGVVTPPPLQLWLHAVLTRFVSLVQGARTTLGMIFKRNHRDWHMEDAQDDLPQAKFGIQLQKEPNHTHGVILGLVPRISVGTPRGLSIDPREAINQDARHTAELDIVGVARTRTIPVIPGKPKARPGTQGRQAQAPPRVAPGFRLALTRVRNDTVDVSTNLA